MTERNTNRMASDENADLALARRALIEGRVVAAATETFFGFLADATRADAVDRLFALKRGRDIGKGVSLLLPSREAWASLVIAIPPAADRLADAFWPGPLTIALAARLEAGIDPRLLMNETIAVRLAGSSVASAITSAMRIPLTATSANLPGSPPLLTAEEVCAHFADPVSRGDLVVVRECAPGGQASTYRKL